MGVWVGGAHISTHTHINHNKHVVGHLQFLFMYFLACTCLCICARMHNVCMHAGAPPSPQIIPTHLPSPQSQGGPKSLKFNKSGTNQDNSILFENFVLIKAKFSLQMDVSQSK